MTILSWCQFPDSFEFKKIGCGNLAKSRTHPNPHKYNAPVIGFPTIDSRDNVASHNSTIFYAPFPASTPMGEAHGPAASGLCPFHRYLSPRHQTIKNHGASKTTKPFRRKRRHPTFCPPIAPKQAIAPLFCRTILEPWPCFEISHRYSHCQ